MTVFQTPYKNDFNKQLDVDDVTAIHRQFENLAAKLKWGALVLAASKKKDNGMDVLTVTLNNTDGSNVKSTTVVFREVIAAHYTETETTVQIERANGKVLAFRYANAPAEFLQTLKKLAQAQIAEAARAAFKTSTPKF